MPPERYDAVPDPYLYDIPTEVRQNLCQILLKQNVWQILAERMQYDRSEIDEIKSYTYETDDREAEELLIRWGEHNHTVTELFVLLSRIQQYAAMNTIKKLVDSRYHRLIGKVQLTDALTELSLYLPMRNIGIERSFDKVDVGNFGGTIPEVDYELISGSTNDWSEANVLGKGGFATVFKGMWQSTPVAIKRFEERGKAKTPIQQILNELKHLNSCRHCNILPLYAVSVNGAQPCLVYELMQGSLEQRLFKQSSNIEPLSWQERIDIAGGTARGLQVLHTFQKRPLIHGDIKPANILLDRNSQPKIGDFGLAREGIENETTFVSQAYGTRPYLPYEYVQFRKLTTKVDSYSFGIVLFELSTGLRAYDKGTELFLINTVKSHYKEGKLLKLIDEKAVHVDGKEKTFKKIIDLGIVCTKIKYKERPDMVKVLKFFEDVLNFKV